MSSLVRGVAQWGGSKHDYVSFEKAPSIYSTRFEAYTIKRKRFTGFTQYNVHNVLECAHEDMHILQISMQNGIIIWLISKSDSSLISQFCPHVGIKQWGGSKHKDEKSGTIKSEDFSHMDTQLRQILNDYVKRSPTGITGAKASNWWAGYFPANL